MPAMAVPIANAPPHSHPCAALPFALEMRADMSSAVYDAMKATSSEKTTSTPSSVLVGMRRKTLKHVKKSHSPGYGKILTGL